MPMTFAAIGVAVDPSHTAMLRPSVAGQAEELRGELARVERELEARAVLRRRDYCFCLYPDSVLRPFCTAFL